MWSDPRPIQGRQLSARGAGVEFGQDITHEFLRTNHAALIIRSHECVREGFELLHSGRLITLFSARYDCTRRADLIRYFGTDTSQRPSGFITCPAHIEQIRPPPHDLDISGQIDAKAIGWHPMSSIYRHIGEIRSQLHGQALSRGR